jgi:hypothetical protein
MKQTKLKNTFLYKSRNTFEHGPSHPPKQHLVCSFVAIEHKYRSLEMGENEFKWMAIIVRHISQLQPMVMGSTSF